MHGIMGTSSSRVAVHCTLPGGRGIIKRGGQKRQHRSTRDRAGRPLLQSRRPKLSVFFWALPLPRHAPKFGGRRG